MEFEIKKPIITDIENKIEERNKGFLNFFIVKNVPDAAMPNKAIETTIKAK